MTKAAPEAKPNFWEWTPEGVTIGGKSFAFAKLSPGLLEEYSERLLEVSEAFKMMLQLRQTFVSGALATYENAWMTARHLQREYRTAENVLQDTALEIAILFEPADLTEFFHGKPPSLLKCFIEEALQKVGVER